AEIAPGGSPVGSFTPDPVAYGGPLPGLTTSQFGGGSSGTLGQYAGSDALWAGDAPYSQERFNQLMGWLSYNNQPTFSYDDYLSTWNQLRASGGPFQGDTSTSAEPGGVGAGGLHMGLHVSPT